MFNDGSHSSAVTATGIALELSARPSVLPADGGSYQAIVLQFKNLTSGQPYLPISNVLVYLTSSSPQTGSVPSQVTFQANNLFVVINFTTTTLAGNTTVSAVSAGYQLSTLSIVTKTVGGIPNALDVFLSPTQIPPDRKLSSEVVVEAVDAFNNPVDLGSSLTVVLSSSNTQIGSVPSSLTIPAGQSFGFATFASGYIAGQTTITAAAGNYSTGSAVMTTTGPVARRLVLSGPQIIPASTGQTVYLSVQLQDSNSDTPALAPNPVSVVLTSDNTSVATISRTTVTIPAGSSYLTAILTSGGLNGSATITASAQGYVKGSLTILGVNPSTTPNALSEYFVPSTLLPNNTDYHNALVVQLASRINGSIVPAIAQNPITIYARSSNNATMQVNTISGLIAAGNSEVAIDVSSTYLPGTAEITAQSPGMVSSTQQLLSFGPSPNSLSVTFAPQILLSDGKTYDSVTVGLIDNATAQPARAPVNTIVNLASNVASLGQIESSVTIPAGQTYARASFNTFVVNGTTLITASASNYTSANSTLNLVTKAATNLGLYVSPKVVLGNGQAFPNLVVQLQDPNGNPEKTDIPVTVRLSVRNTTVGTVPQQVVIPPGETFTQIMLGASLDSGSTNITAVATGFQSAQTSFATFLLPLNVSTLVANPHLLPGQRTNVTITVKSSGLPVSNANVNWSISAGTFLNSVNITDTNGTASAEYAASALPGFVSFEAQISKPGYSMYLAKNTLHVLNTTVITTTSSGNFLTSQISFIPIWSLIIIGVAVPAAAFFFIRRRSGGGEVIEDDE